MHGSVDRSAASLRLVLFLGMRGAFQTAGVLMLPVTHIHPRKKKHDDTVSKLIRTDTSQLYID